MTTEIRNQNYWKIPLETTMFLDTEKPEVQMPVWVLFLPFPQVFPKEGPDLLSLLCVKVLHRLLDKQATSRQQP